MSTELRFDTGQKALLLSGFSGGYILTQVAGGFLGDAYGGKHFQTLALVGPAVGMLLVPLAVDLGGGVGLLHGIYFTMGFLCGPVARFSNWLLCDTAGSRGSTPPQTGRCLARGTL